MNIPEEVMVLSHVINSIAQYLEQRPYVEVAPMMTALSAAVTAQARADAALKADQQGQGTI